MATGKTKRSLGTAALVAALALIGAGVAGGYSIPLVPGTPGGPPTPPNGAKGNGQTNRGATALGTLLAGFTADELVNTQTFSLIVQFPKGGEIYGRVSVPGVGELGEGFATRANAGFEPMGVSLSAKGRTYLNEVNGDVVTLTVRYAFQPIKGKSEYSEVQIQPDL
jgi:hypothetical protein